MDLKIGFMFLLYYSIITLVFVIPDSPFNSAGITTNVDLNSSALTSEEIDTGGLFGTGISFERWVIFYSFGIITAEDTPTWFKVIYSIFQIMVNLLALMWIISSIWDG